MGQNEPSCRRRRRGLSSLNGMKLEEESEIILEKHFAFEINLNKLNFF